MKMSIVLARVIVGVAAVAGIWIVGSLILKLTPLLVVGGLVVLGVWAWRRHKRNRS